MKQELFSALESKNLKTLGKLLSNQRSKKNNFDVREIYKTLTVTTSETLGQLLQNQVQDLLETIISRSENKSEVLLENEEVKAIECIVEFIKIFIAPNDVVAPIGVFEAVLLLHDSLFSLGDSESARKLQNGIAALCELWYHQDRNESQALVPQTVTFLLVKSLDIEAKVADIRRLYKFRETLTLIEVMDPASEYLQRLLLRTLIHSLFLAEDAGKKFIVYLFTLHPKFIDEIHLTIKSSLVTCKKWMAESYADIYFKAWKVLTGQELITLEHNCIQELIHSSIYVSNTKILARVQTMMSYFHKLRLSTKNLDEMLVRLYEPILWRSLKVANPIVRKNAVVQFAGAFPLTCDSWVSSEIDTAHTKQLDLLDELLKDVNPIVRKEAIMGAGKILSLYFEIFPVSLTHTLLANLILTQSKDKTSSDNRASVFEAINVILDNPLSHSLLSSMIPTLNYLIHDRAEGVRFAFSELLLSIKGIKQIKFYEVVPAEHLVARLSLSNESKRCKRHFTTLLRDSYYPVEQSSSEIIKRCISLTRMNITGAQEFFRQVSDQVNVGALVKFLVKLWQKCVSKWLDKYRFEYESSEDGEPVRKKAKTSRFSLTKGDNKVVFGLVCIIVSTWEEILPILNKKKNLKLKEYLESVFNDDAMLMMYEGFTTKSDSSSEDQSVETVIFKLASFIEPTALGSFVQSIAGTVSSSSKVAKVIPFMKTLFAWNKQKRATKLICDCLKELPAAVEAGEDISEAEKESKFGLKLLDKVLQDEDMRKTIVNDPQYSSFILKKLKPYKKMTEAKLHDWREIDIPQTYLFAAMTIYYKILFLRSVENSDDIFEESAIKFMKLVFNAFSKSDDEEVLMFCMDMIELTMKLSCDFWIYSFGSDKLVMYLLSKGLKILEIGSDLEKGFVTETTNIIFKILYHAYDKEFKIKEINPAQFLIESLRVLEKSFLTETVYSDLNQLSKKRPQMGELLTEFTNSEVFQEFLQED